MSRDELLVYYERELRFIRKLAMEFAEKYPQIGSRLQLEATKCEDPHVERLIEAFSMLTARVHLRLDDEFSEVTDALLGILYPHYLRPVPSMTIVQMKVDPEEGSVSGGLLVPRHSMLHSRPVSGVRCGFRTAYATRLYPIEVEAVSVVRSLAELAPVPEAARSALRIELSTTNGVPFSELEPDALRFFLDATSADIHRLYELFLRDAQGMLVRPLGEGADGDARHVSLPPDAIRPVGFERDEGLLEYPPESFVGYRLLQEYFTFPEKFLFVDLVGLGRVTKHCAANRLEIHVLLTESPTQLDIRVEKQNFKLGCTPAVNLFPRTADPIRLTHAAVEYPVQPDARSPNTFEVHSITRAVSTTPGTGEATRFQPYFGIRHGAVDDTKGAFWHARRRPSMRKGDSGSEVYISLVDPHFDPLEVPVDVLNVDTLCTNRGLPARLPFGSPEGDFHLEGRPGVSKIVALRKPTDPLSAPASASNRWRLVSHLSLNHLSLASSAPDSAGDEGGAALAALREILQLYDFRDSAVTRQAIAGIVGLRSRHVVRRVGAGASSGFARGLEVELEFDPAQYIGFGAFLFASVLERFLGLYTSVNSFTQTIARERQSPGVLKRWSPRAGDRVLS